MVVWVPCIYLAVSRTCDSHQPLFTKVCKVARQEPSFCLGNTHPPLIYAKILRTLITAVNITYLAYHIRKVWLHDANVDYLVGINTFHSL